MTQNRSELIIAEIPKGRSDIYRITLAQHREGRQIRVALFHRHAGGLTAIPGKAIAIRPDRAGPLIAALQKAQTAAINEVVAAGLDWLTEGGRHG